MNLKDIFQAAMTTLVAMVVLMVLIIATSDCDLFLWAAEKFGKSPGSLAGQVVWITGASSGIGEELAYVLAASGCKLVLSARRAEELQRVKQRCLDAYNRPPEDVFVLPLDMRLFDTHPGAVGAVIQHFNHVDILINNAGRSQRALWANTSLDVDRQMLEVNTLGPLSLTKVLLPHMMERKSGHIAVVSSVAGRFGAPGLGSYSGSKHALHGWFDTLRMEAYEDNIRVTMLCPGPVFTDALKHAFTGQPEQELGIEMDKGGHRMTAQRCAHLCAVAISNSLDEAWISNQPELSYLYLNQYLPAVTRWASVQIGASRVQKIKAGKLDLHV